MLDPKAIRSRFPIFDTYPDLIYFDNAATSQKPLSVIKGLENYYRETNANIHRGIYPLAAKATTEYEAVRKKIKSFLGANEDYEVIYTKGTTDAINLVANAFVKPIIGKKENIVITAMEHHANLIPWQALCREKKAELRIISINEDGELNTDRANKLLNNKTRLLSLTHISNTLGAINPINELIELAHRRQIPVLIDGAQSAPHLPLSIHDWDIDMYTFSGHKVFGPTGIGALCAKKEILERMQPYQFGGDMIKQVSFGEVSFADLPKRLEPGTPNIAGVIGLGHALDFLEEFDKQEIHDHVSSLAIYALEKLREIAGFHLVGNAKKRSGIISFTLADIHPHDMATFLGEENIAIRAGHHCTQPLMKIFDVPATARASFTFYNDKEEVDRFIETIKEMQEFFT